MVQLLDSLSLEGGKNVRMLGRRTKWVAALVLSLSLLLALLPPSVAQAAPGSGGDELAFTSKLQFAGRGLVVVGGRQFQLNRVTLFDRDLRLGQPAVVVFRPVPRRVLVAQRVFRFGAIRPAVFVRAPFRFQDFDLDLDDILDLDDD